MIIDKKELMKQLREDNLKGGYMKAEVILGEGSEAPYFEVKGEDFSDFTEAKFILAVQVLLENLKESASKEVKYLLTQIAVENLGEINLDDN